MTFGWGKPRDLAVAIPLECDGCGRVYMQTLLGDLSPIRCDCGDLVLRDAESQQRELQIQRLNRRIRVMGWVVPVCNISWMVFSFLGTIINPLTQNVVMCGAATASVFASTYEFKRAKRRDMQEKARRRARRRSADSRNAMVGSHLGLVQ